MLIDSDSHYLPKDVYQYVDKKYQHLLPTFNFSKGLDSVTGNDPVKYNVNPSPLHTHSELPGIQDLDMRLADLDKMQIDLQVLCPQDLALRFNYSVDTDLAIEMTHSYNLSILNVDRTKFIPLGYLPMQSIEHSIKEMLWLKDNGIKQVYIDYIFAHQDNGHCSLWSKVKDIDVFLKTAEENNIILYVHKFMHHLLPSKQQLIDRSLMVYPECSFISDLIFNGILDKYSNLKIVLAEPKTLGSIILDSVNECINLYNNKKFSCLHPSYYFKRNFYITIDIEATDVVSKLIEYFGDDKLLFSTDYPHNDDSGANKWNDSTDLKKSSLSEEQKNKIAYKNALALFFNQ